MCYVKNEPYAFLVPFLSPLSFLSDAFAFFPERADEFYSLLTNFSVGFYLQSTNSRRCSAAMTPTARLAWLSL